MTGLESALSALVGHLTRRGARFAIVGGLAVSARTEPRFTRDADVCVAVHDDQESEALVRSLQAAGYRVLALIEQERTGRIAAVRLETPDDSDEGVTLDLLFASSGVEWEVLASADEMELFEGSVLPVASLSSLIALKVLARDDAARPQDRVDLVGLLRLASASDVAEAFGLLALITDRGYDRGRDLAADLASLRAELGV